MHATMRDVVGSPPSRLTLHPTTHGQGGLPWFFRLEDALTSTKPLASCLVQSDSKDIAALNEELWAGAVAQFGRVVA